jgi:hypothetical protein
VMRHFLLPRPPAAHPGGVHPAATMARLVAPPGLLDRPSPSLPGAGASAVDLTAVAATANDDLVAASGAQEQAARSRLGLPCVAEQAWTNAIVGRIVLLHACPARCGARRRCRTCKSRAAPCLPPNFGRLVPRRPPAGRRPSPHQHRQFDSATAVQRLIRPQGRVVAPPATPPGDARRRLRALPRRR